MDFSLISGNRVQGNMVLVGKSWIQVSKKLPVTVFHFEDLKLLFAANQNPKE